VPLWAEAQPLQKAADPQPLKEQMQMQMLSAGKAQQKYNRATKRIYE
jgi:hypothetical protein